MKTNFKLLTISLMILPVAAGAVSITAGNAVSRSDSPQSLSGITYAGGNTFNAVADDASNGEIGIYPYVIALSADGKTVSSATTCTTDNAVKLSGTSDLEAIAFDPASGNVWVADESKKTIKEYNPTTGAIISTLDYPAIMKQNVGNYGFESLTISGDGLTLWTCNEEALTCDGARSSYTAGTTVRLVKFTRATVRDAWTVTAMYPYTTEKWHNPYTYGGKARRGVSDLCALPDGSLLVLERELSFSEDGTDFWAGLSGVYYYSVCRVESPSLATDVQGYASLSNSMYAAAVKTKLYENNPSSWINYEGICLGPRLSNGTLSVLLISDSGDGYSDPMIQPLVLSGLNVQTLNFPAPSAATASVVGSNYRLLNGSQVTVSLSGEGIAPTAYTNNGAVCAAASWTLPNHSPAAGTGASVSFTVAAADTLNWSVALSAADTLIGLNDSFEGYAEGALAATLAGWSGDGEVTAMAYAPPTPPGYPMARETHTKVLSVEEATRTLPSSAAVGCKIDLMVSARRSKEALQPCPDDAQVAIAADENGRICLWHLYDDNGVWTRGWTPLAETVYADETWIRVGVDLDYSNSPSGDAFCRVKIDGSICPTARGVRAPDDMTPFGAWHYLAKNRLSGGVTTPTELGLIGTLADDLIVTSAAYESEHTGPTSTNGVAFAWFDQWNLPRKPDAAAPRIPGYTLMDVHDSGVHPYSDEPLTIKGLSVGTDGRVHMSFNGYKVNPSTGYRVIGSSSPDFRSSGDVSAEGEFQGDSTTWSTTWEVDVISGQGSAEFFKIEAVR